MKQFVLVAVFIVVAIVVAQSWDTTTDKQQSDTQITDTQTTDTQFTEPQQSVPASKNAFQDLSYETALTTANQEGKIVMLDFTTTWCGYCRLLEKNTFSKDSVQQFLKTKVVAIKVDGDKQRELVQKYKVRGYPTIVFVNQDGLELGRITGYVQAGDFLSNADSYYQMAKS